MASDGDRGCGPQYREATPKTRLCGGEPQLSLFLPPISHWGFPVGEPTQKPSGTEPSAAHEDQPPRPHAAWGVGLEWQTEGIPHSHGQKPWSPVDPPSSGCSLRIICCFLSIPLLKGISAPTPKMNQSIPTATILPERGALGGAYLSIPALPEGP